MLAGFGLIALAWVIQLFNMTRGNRSVQPLFIGVYIVGVIILAASDVMGGDVNIAYAELVTIIASLLTLVALLVTKPKKIACASCLFRTPPLPIQVTMK